MYHVNKLDLMIQTAIPTVYEKGLSYYEVLNTILQKVNELIDDSNAYFGVDVKAYISELLNEWKIDGTLFTLINADDMPFTDTNSLFTVDHVGNALVQLGDDLNSLIPLTQTEFNGVNALIAADKTIYLKGNYTAAQAIIMKDDAVIIGLGDTIITFASNSNGFVFPADCKRSRIENIRIVGESNVNSLYGMKFNEDNAGFLNVFKRVYITKFKWGLFARDLFWCNTLENITFDDCYYSIDIQYKTVGACINNNFKDIYFFKSTIKHMILSGLRQATFTNINCGVNNNEQCLEIGSGSYAFDQANFEQDNLIALAPNYKFIVLKENCDVQIKNAEFYVQSNASNTIYAIEVYENSKLTLDNCSMNTAGGVVNFKPLLITNIQNTRKIELIHSDAFIINLAWFNNLGENYTPKNRTPAFAPIACGKATNITLGVDQVTLSYSYLSSPTILIMPDAASFAAKEVIYVDTITASGFTVKALDITTGNPAVGVRTFNYLVVN